MSKWYDNAVFYHMYPLGLSGAPFENKEETVVHRFVELEKWLTHIAGLGCDAVYIGPLFESTTHGYDTKDYKLVDRRLGDNEDFKCFVKEAHALGLRIVVPVTADGIRASILDGTIRTTTDLDMKHGAIALNWSTSTCRTGR